jgi:hypothetical protein
MATLDGEVITITLAVKLRCDVPWWDALKMRLAGATFIQTYVQHYLARQERFQTFLDAADPVDVREDGTAWPR